MNENKKRVRLFVTDQSETFESLSKRRWLRLTEKSYNQINRRATKTKIYSVDKIKKRKRAE